MRQASLYVGGLVGTLLASASPVAAVTHVVNQTGFTFVPSSIAVDPGDTIEWHWSSGVHTVTSGTSCIADGVFFNAPLTAGNPLVSFVVPNDGTTSIPYFCTPHCAMGMAGLITVSQPPIPAVSTWGLAVMGLLVLTAGTVVAVRRASSLRTVA